MPTKVYGLGLVLAILSIDPAAAQGLETLGNRAAALSAFVAVADDVSAVAWNPAGLVIGPFFNASLDLGRSKSVPDDAPEAFATASRLGTSMIAVGVPPLGLSYYRVASRVLEGVGSQVGDDPNQDGRHVVARSLVTTHLGATFLQSLGDHLTVGTTLKLVRGSVATALFPVATWSAGFDRLDLVETEGSTRADLDVGAMFAMARVRAGIVARNLTKPEFDVSDDEESMDIALDRHARIGVAWGDRWPGLARTIAAVDVDLTRVPHSTGERRDIAAGIERWLLRRQQLGIRGGVRASTVGDARPVVSGGLSYAIRSGTYVDAYLARGDREHTAWGVGARLTY